MFFTKNEENSYFDFEVDSFMAASRVNVKTMPIRDLSISLIKSRITVIMSISIVKSFNFWYLTLSYARIQTVNIIIYKAYALE